MKNHSSQWKFDERRGRPALSDREVAYWRQNLARVLKVGIELEYNLPEGGGSCRRNNYLCACTATFEPEQKMPNTKLCYEQCASWDNGNCEIAKQHGCAGIYCSAYKSPCPNCNKYDRGCNTCPNLYKASKEPDHARKLIELRLRPTNFVGQVGQHGVYRVVKDGSLLGKGGVEVVTTGRRPEFNSLHQMLQNIVKEVKDKGAYVNERCSVHVHLLASYLTPGFSKEDRGGEFVASEVSELEKPVPEIILANFHQLIRRYQTALIWMSSTGDKREALTRWEKYRKSILHISAIRKPMAALAKEVMALGYKPKYSLLNYEQMRFNSQGDVDRLHLEIRHMDGSLSPAGIAAQAILLYGLMLKAVEISRHGILRVGEKPYMDLQFEQMKALCNGDGDWNATRLSDTRNLQPYMPQLVEQALQMVRIVKNNLTDQVVADDILKSLAYRPISLRRIDGMTWEAIEEELYPRSTESSEIKQFIQHLLDTASIVECENGSEWMDSAAREIATKRGQSDSSEKVADCRHQVERYITSELTGGRAFWSVKQGSYVAR